MEFRLEQTDPPVEEPVSLTTQKGWMRITESDEDTKISALIVAARRWAETFTNRAFISQTWKYYRDSFPRCREIYLPKSPLSSVVSVKYYDGNGDLQTLSSDVYQVDSVGSPGRVVLNSGESWPVTELGRINSVVIEFEAGWTDAEAVPEEIKTGIQQLVTHWFENPQPTITGTIISDVPMMIQFLFWPYKITRF